MPSPIWKFGAYYDLVIRFPVTVMAPALLGWWADGKLGTSPWLLPRDKFEDLDRPKFAARNHYHHFVDACLGGEMTTCHFGQSGPMTEAILLGTVAVRTPDQWLHWNSAALKIPNQPKAEPYLKRTYREGWHVT